jgi:hypothetical protein
MIVDLLMRVVKAVAAPLDARTRNWRTRSWQAGRSTDYLGRCDKHEGQLNYRRGWR